MENIWVAYRGPLPGESKANAHHADNLWETLRKNLKEVELIVKKLENLLKKILGEKEGKGEDTSTHESESAKKEWFSKFHILDIKKIINLQMKGAAVPVTCHSIQYQARIKDAMGQFRRSRDDPANSLAMDRREELGHD